MNMNLSKRMSMKISIVLIITLYSLQQPKATTHCQNPHFIFSLGTGNASDFGAKNSGNLKIQTLTPRLN